MDLLFSKYASPFILIDNLILTNSLNDFIDDFIKFTNEKRNWEFFLHKVYEKSWSEFVNDIEISENRKQVDLDATLNKSKNMLNNFTPTESEV